MIRKALAVCSAATVCAAGLMSGVAAETSPEDAAEYRQAFMTALRGHAGAISMQARGIAGDAQYLAAHVDALVALADELAVVFPEGSLTAESEALPAIWERPEDFARAVADFQAAAKRLGETGRDDIAAIDTAFRDVGKACKGCHESFRLKD